MQERRNEFDRITHILREKNCCWIRTEVYTGYRCESGMQSGLRIHLILMRIRILDPHCKKMDPDPGHFFKINKAEFSNWLSYFFMPKLYEPFRNQEIVIISLFSIVQIQVQRVKKFFFQFLVDILPLGSAYFCGSGSRKPKSCGSNGS